MMVSLICYNCYIGRLREVEVVEPKLCLTGKPNHQLYILIEDY